MTPTIHTDVLHDSVVPPSTLRCVSCHLKAMSSINKKYLCVCLTSSSQIIEYCKMNEKPNVETKCSRRRQMLYNCVNLLFLFLHLLHLYLYRIVYYRSEAVLFCDNYNLRKVSKPCIVQNEEKASELSQRALLFDAQRCLLVSCIFFFFHFCTNLKHVGPCNPPTFHACSKAFRDHCT